MADKKPTGFNKFSALARKIVAVPKEKVDERIAKEKSESPRRPQK